MSNRFENEGKTCPDCGGCLEVYQKNVQWIAECEICEQREEKENEK